MKNNSVWFVLTAALVAALTCPVFGQETHNPQFAVVGEPTIVAGPVAGTTSPPETKADAPPATPPATEATKAEIRTIIREKVIVRDRAKARHDWAGYDSARVDIRDLNARLSTLESEVSTVKNRVTDLENAGPIGGKESDHRKMDSWLDDRGYTTRGWVRSYVRRYVADYVQAMFGSGSAAAASATPPPGPPATGIPPALGSPPIVGAPPAAPPAAPEMTKAGIVAFVADRPLATIGGILLALLALAGLAKIFR